MDMVIAVATWVSLIGIPILIVVTTYNLYKKQRPSNFQASWEDEKK